MIAVLPGRISGTVSISVGHGLPASSISEECGSGFPDLCPDLEPASCFCVCSPCIMPLFLGGGGTWTVSGWPAVSQGPLSV